MTDHRESSSAIPNETQQEIYVVPSELQVILDVARDCVNTALKYDWAIVSDESYYNDIPHSNSLRTPDIRLALKDTRFSSLDIRLPRKDEDLRISIMAHATSIPNRTIELTETTGLIPGHTGSFFVNDSHALTAARHGRTVDPLLSSTEVAHWLYAQAGLNEEESSKRIRAESDPVRNACEILSARAQSQYDVRQVRVPFLNPNVEFYGQLVEKIDTDNPLAPPQTRMYSGWINSRHQFGEHTVTERLLVEHSPEDPTQLQADSPLTHVVLSLESESPEFDVVSLRSAQATWYEGGRVSDQFALIRDAIDGQYVTPTRM